ncbi:MAG TPA: hypothetical protein VFN49_13645 [Candidatus Aquilonibacter sp.]|nr:hypothetical protein [Candidatus Aquilonibacter sp.]
MAFSRTRLTGAFVCAMATLTSCHGAAADTNPVVWRAGDPALGRWIPATSGQCGRPINTRARFIFSLSYDPAAGCMRNQANPIDAGGNAVYLRDGLRYTWTFRFIDGTPYLAQAAKAGPDHDARSLIWQIHGNIETGPPCTALRFTNGDNDVTYDDQRWGFSTCNGTVWHGRYEPGESDEWKIVAVISRGPDGMTQLYRNGVLQFTDRGANYHDSHPTPGDPQGYPWWNFGPYKWIWKDNPTNSSMNATNMTIDDMLLKQG